MKGVKGVKGVKGELLSIDLVTRSNLGWQGHYKTTEKGNYSIKLRKKINTNEVEEIWNGDKEKEKLNTEYFGLGDLEVSFNDKYLAYSLDLKGSEYYTIHVRDIETNKLITEKIQETSGSITFSLDDKYIFYSKLDEHHRPRKIFRHKLGSSVLDDELIFEEKSEAFTVGLGISSDEKFFFITSSDHNTSEQYYFAVDEQEPKPKLIQKRERGIIYSVNSWDENFYKHTNKDAEDFKIERARSLEDQNWEVFIPARDEVLIGGLVFLKNRPPDQYFPVFSAYPHSAAPRPAQDIPTQVGC